VSDNDEVSFLKHSQSSAAATLREASAYAALREARPKILVNRDIYSGSESGHEAEKAALLLTQHPHTKAIFASGTPGTSAMLKVLTEKNLGGTIKLVGFGFDLNTTVAAAIENGAMHGWIAQLPGDIGARGVSAALSLIRGEAVPDKIYCDFLVVTKENLKDPKLQAFLQ
jgi:ribose transport system substrate-binding protein